MLKIKEGHGRRNPNNSHYNIIIHVLHIIIKMNPESNIQYIQETIFFFVNNIVNKKLWIFTAENTQ